MSTDQISLLIRRLDELFNKPDMRIADEIFTANFQAHFPLTPPLDREAFKTIIDSFYEAFPDFLMQICDTIATDTRLVLRVSYFGSHKGDFMGISATGREVIMRGIIIFGLEDGLIAESWTEIDIMGVLQQISAENAY